MIDFYGGPGTFASWPHRVRTHAVETTPVNMLDWAGAYAFTPSNTALSPLAVPTQIIVGALSHPAVKRANEAVMQRMPGAVLSDIEGAAHFMIATHPEQVAKIVSDHIVAVESGSKSNDKQQIS